MEKLKGALVVGFLRLFALLPWRVAQNLGAAIGWLMWKLPNGSRDVASINLRKCFPELDEAGHQRLLRQSLMAIGKTLTESACAWIWPAERTLKLIRHIEGLDVLQAALDSGKGVVLISSHLGNWEVLLQYASSVSKPMLLYRPIKMQAVDDLLIRKRTQQGNSLAPSTKEGILSLIKTVRRGGVAGIAADPEPSVSSGLFVPFLGVPALTSKFVPS